MKDLVTIFETAGCKHVRTYVQSGNVVFEATERIAATIGERVRVAVKERFGHSPVTIVRTGDELEAAIAANPFLARGADLSRLQVMFLEDTPTAERAALLEPDRSPGDEFALVGRELFLYQPAGIADSKLTNAYFDARLKTTTTARNWRTVLAIADLLDAKPKRVR
jgi:uncharacterized protein (DUF1697 family)